MSSSSTTDFIVSMANTTRVIEESAMANERAHRAEMEAIQAKAAAREAASDWRSTDAGLRQRVEELAREKNMEKRFGERMMAKNEELTATIKEREAIILEWMHSNEAFKRLARGYGQKLGLTNEQRLFDLRSQLVDVAEENHKFSTTKIGNQAKEDLKS